MDSDLREVLMPIAIMGSFGTALYFFTKALTDYILKKKMIEKGFVNDDTQAIFKQHTSDNRYSSLKWGMIIFFAGLALIIMEFIPARPDSPLPYGLFAVSVSLGFLIYYFMIQKDAK
jgi:ABC-type maltose transport system permease subunit